MKYIFTLLSALLIFAGADAQISWDKAVADTARGFETTGDIETHNKVTFAKAGVYRWIRTYKQSCSVKTAICDKNSCYLEETDSANFEVAANESFDMICHFYPYDKCCPEGAMVSLYVFKVDEPSVNSTATYFLDLWCQSASIIDVSTNTFSVYPNPSSSVLYLNSTTKIEDIEIIDLVGNTVYTSSVNPGSINISNLSSGVYMIAVKSNGIRMTKRFVKK